MNKTIMSAVMQQFPKKLLKPARQGLQTAGPETISVSFFMETIAKHFLMCYHA